MRKELEKFRITLQQINSPAEFWTKFHNNNEAQNLCPTQNQNVHCKTINTDHNQYLVRDNAALFVWKCHLAFIAPTNSTNWSSLANDKFIEYTQHFDDLAITIPSLASATSFSTAVILWGLRKRLVNALEANEDDWENINLMLIFQGVARSTTDIEIVEHYSIEPQDFIVYPTAQLTDNTMDWFENQTKSTDKKWRLVEPSTTKEFIGTPVFISNEMSIYVQEPHHQTRISEMTYEITKKYSKREKHLIKNWQVGEMCITDGTYFRAEIMTVCKKEQKCLVHYIDFGFDGTVEFKDLWRCKLFKKVPIQVRKCYLQEIILPMRNGKISPSRAVLKFTIDMIREKCCSFHIHENLDPSRIDSIPCTVWPLNEPLDLASELISYRMVGIKSKFKGKNNFDVAKRIRHQCDEVILKPSDQLTTFNEFKSFYESNKVIVPKLKTTDSTDDDRKFEVFEEPRKQKSPHENNENKKEIMAEQKQMEYRQFEYKPNPVFDKITKHFRLLKTKKPEFYCQPVYVIDPITILVAPVNAAPTFIDINTKLTENPLLPEHAPCIALSDKIWQRGIVWEKISANKYTILLVDTLTVTPVKRDFVQICPKDLLKKKLEYMKVRLSSITPNPRLRSRDICDYLSKVLLNKKLCLFARTVRMQTDDVPEIELYPNEYSKRSISSEFIERNYYQRSKH